MFYSETLLSKTGPLARVWLSANIERKLSKSHILQSNIENSVSAIVDQGAAPLALRLSGQLLLGVVRIYSRKARYLLDDCNEAILKIKMAFRPGNVDLPANQSHTANPASLTLPDALTEIDLLGPGPDPSLLLTQPDADPTLLDFDTSQQLQHSVEPRRASSVLSALLEDNGFDPRSSTRGARSIEVGRRDSTARDLLDDDTTLRPLDDDGIIIDLDDPDPVLGHDDLDITDLNTGFHRPGHDTNFETLDGDALVPLDDELPAASPTQPSRKEARLSSVRLSADRDVDQSNFQEHESLLLEDEPSVHQAQRAKRRKVLQADADTQIHNNQIREQQNDRSKILKPTTYLPRDPALLALMEMQRTGGFVSNILGDGRSRGWAPELRGILSLEVIKGGGDLKRKRDSGVAGFDVLDARSRHSQLADTAQDEDTHLPTEAAGDATLDGGNDMPTQADVDYMQADDEADAFVNHDNGVDPFDVTTVPILHPSESGPVSLGTKHAVHLLREKFGPAAASSPNKRQNSSVYFHDVLPERTTTRADATKMFFEVLVLSTKDAIKIEQAEDNLGGPLRVRAKRGLWGSWAETEAGGEIAQQEQADFGRQVIGV